MGGCSSCQCNKDSETNELLIDEVGYSYLSESVEIKGTFYAARTSNL